MKGSLNLWLIAVTPSSLHLKRNRLDYQTPRQSIFVRKSETFGWQKNVAKKRASLLESRVILAKRRSCAPLMNLSSTVDNGSLRWFKDDHAILQQLRKKLEVIKLPLVQLYEGGVQCLWRWWLAIESTTGLVTTISTVCTMCESNYTTDWKYCKLHDAEVQCILCAWQCVPSSTKLSWTGHTLPGAQNTLNLARSLAS